MINKNPNSLANLKRSPRSGTRYSYAVMSAMVARMLRGRFTVQNVAKSIGVSYSSANRWTTALHKAGCLHVVEYLRSPNNRTTSRVYQWGSGDDALRPAKLPRKQYHAQWRARRRTLDGALHSMGKRNPPVSSPDEPC